MFEGFTRASVPVARFAQDESRAAEGRQSLQRGRNLAARVLAARRR